MRTRFSLGLTLSVALAAFGCLDEASVNNDNSSSATDGTNTGGNGSGVNATTNGTNNAGTNNAGTNTNGTNTNGTNTNGTNTNGTNTNGTNTNGTNTNGTSGGDGGVSTGGADGGDATGTSQVSGTATAKNCLSTGVPQGDFCGSYYCGVTFEQLAPEIDTAGVCGNNLEYACVAELTAVVTQCGKGNIATALGAVLGGPWDPYRTAVADCVQNDSGVVEAGVSSACVGCFVEAALCCAQNEDCRNTCLEPDQAACDAAQQAAGCIQGAQHNVFTCSGLPNPF